MSPAPLTGRRRVPGLAAVAAGVLIAAVAFLARLVPVLNGGGLSGYGNYDDGVYFAAGEGLAAGRLPYRDFLILHPPGIAVALAPFGWLAQVAGDPTAFAVARVVFMAMGSISAVLVLAVLWTAFGRSLHPGFGRPGRFGAVIGGLTYAVFFAAVYGEHSTLLEGPQNLVLLIALLIIVRPRSLGESSTDSSGGPGGWRRHLPWLLAGAVLGLSPTLKIWGVLPVLAVLIWVVVVRGWSAGLRVLFGAAVSMTAVLGPFFVAAPVQMWRMVVLAQLGRPLARAPIADRLSSLAGLELFERTDPLTGQSLTSWPLLIGACVGWLLVMAMAAVQARARFFVALHGALVAFLLIEPTWFMHYGSFVAPTAALSLGSAFVTLSRQPASSRLRYVLCPPLAVLAVAGVLASGVPLLLPAGALGRLYPTADVSGAVQTDGCVTSDDPSNLILSGVLSDNLARDCPLVVDLQGYSNAQPVDGRQVARPENDAFQQTALDYLGSGSRTVVSRLGPKAFTDETIATIRSWPVQARVGNIVVRAPNGSGG